MIQLTAVTLYQLYFLIVFFGIIALAIGIVMWKVNKDLKEDGYL